MCIFFFLNIAMDSPWEYVQQPELYRTNIQTEIVYFLGYVAHRKFHSDVRVCMYVNLHLYTFRFNEFVKP